MPIAIAPRKGLVAKHLAEANPDLSPSEIAKRAGTNRSFALKAIGQARFGRDKPKSRVTT
jgi:hypothetical protein